MHLPLMPWDMDRLDRGEAELILAYWNEYKAQLKRQARDAKRAGR